MRISDWSSDVCSSDLPGLAGSSCPYVLGAKQPAFLRDQNDNERGCAQQRETQGDWRGGAAELLPDQKTQQRPTDRHDSALNRSCGPGSATHMFHGHRTDVGTEKTEQDRKSSVKGQSV